MKLNDQKTLGLLIILVAVTMAAQYALQGWLTAGKSPETIHNLFWIADALIWSARALVEAFVLFYLFSTPTNSRLLTFFEIALVVLIVVTLGPVLAAVGQGQPMSEALPVVAYWLWSFAIASYAPLMIAAAGFAYRMRVQGVQAEAQVAEIFTAGGQTEVTVYNEAAHTVQPEPDELSKAVHIVQTLKQNKGNQSATARELNTTRRKVASAIKTIEQANGQQRTTDNY